MKSKIATIITLLVLLVGAFAYFYNYGGFQNGQANAIGTDFIVEQNNLLQENMTEVDWQKYEKFAAKVVESSGEVKSDKIVNLREEIRYLLDQLADLKAGE